MKVQEKGRKKTNERRDLKREPRVEHPGGGEENHGPRLFGVCCDEKERREKSKKGESKNKKNIEEKKNRGERGKDRKEHCR